MVKSVAQLPRSDFKANLGNLTFTSLAHFVNDGQVFFVPVIADLLASGKALSPFEITAMLIVFYASSSILSTYVGRLADKSGKRGTIIGLGLALLSSGLLGFYSSMVYFNGIKVIVAVIASAFLAGLGSACYHPLSASILQSAFEQNSRGRALGINGAVGSVGRALYPTLFFWLALSFKTSGALAIFALAGLIASAVVWLGLREYAPSNEVKVSPLVPWKAKGVVARGIAILTVVAFVRSLATQGVLSWIPIYVSTQKGLGVTTSLGYVLSTIYVAAIFGQPFWGWLLDRSDRRVVLAASSAGSGLTILGYLFTTGTLEIVMLLLFGFFTLTAFPLLLSLASDYESTGSDSLANAMVWGVGLTGGSVFGPLITGAIILNDYANLGLAFEVMSMAALASAVGTILLPRPQREHKGGPVVVVDA